MYENRIDVFVHPENTVPPPKSQGSLVGSNSLDGITPFFQIPTIVVPAGTTNVVPHPRVRGSSVHDAHTLACWHRSQTGTLADAVSTATR
jgi:hypothetical protein